MTGLIFVFAWMGVGAILLAVLSWLIDRTVPPYEPRHHDNDPHSREGTRLYDHERDGL